MLRMLKNWKGKIEINGNIYDNVQSVIDARISMDGPLCIKLYPKVEKRDTDGVQRATEENKHRVKVEDTYKITVKAYMTKESTPEFDFMAKWNEDKPMPLRTMVGTIEKETKGMYFMRLRGQGEPVIRCMRCGKSLSNPISRHYGIGPECMSKLGIVADIEDVESIKKQLVNVEWTGWVVKSAITEMEEI